MPPQSESSHSKLNHPFMSLRHPSFRYYWIGMCISLVGTWMQNIAQPWLAYTLTGSPFLLSLIGTLQFAPMLFFSLFAGVLVDKIPKRRILFFTQSASLVIALILSILVWTNSVQYWHILVLATLLGIVNTLDMPTRQSFVIELVGKNDLMNAIALNSMAFNVARIFGPALAGLIMGTAGIAVCFLINAISYLAVIIGLIFVKPIPVPRLVKAKDRILDEIKDGLAFILRTPILLNTLFVVAIVGTFVPNFSVLVPVFAKEILHQNESGFGLLMSFMGVGSFFGAMLVAVLSKSGPKKWVLFGMPGITAIFMILSGATSSYILTAVFLGLTGLTFVTFSSSANSTMQLNASNDYRGRVMSVYTLIFAGSTPFGNLFAGYVAENFSARGGFYACGGMVLLLMGILGAFLMLRRRSLS